MKPLAVLVVLALSGMVSPDKGEQIELAIVELAIYVGEKERILADSIYSMCIRTTCFDFFPQFDHTKQQASCSFGNSDYKLVHALY